MLAELSRAIDGVGIELLPLLATRIELQLGAIARGRGTAPLPQLLHRMRLRDQPVGAHPIELQLAKIVIASFKQAYANGNPENLFYQRQVFAHELLLER